jgi:hypothetical protein
MTEDEALQMFSDWYERCLNSGIEPERIVERMEGMMLVTDPGRVEELLSNTDID